MENKNYEQNYNVYSKDEKELKFWVSKKLEDIKKDILDMTSYYSIENIDKIEINLKISKK